MSGGESREGMSSPFDRMKVWARKRRKFLRRSKVRTLYIIRIVKNELGPRQYAEAPPAPITNADFFKILFGLPRGEEADKTFMIQWNFVDRVFKLFQWLFFAALITYAADKTKSVILSFIAVVLWYTLTKLAYYFYYSYIHKSLFLAIGWRWPKLRFIFIVILCTLVLLFCYLVLVAVNHAFVYYQAHH
jgi:hypothetical protein